MELHRKVKEMRVASHVLRCHTFRHRDEYTVGQHSYDMANLLLALKPNASINLIKAVLWHDVAERWTGDIPSPAKSDPKLRERIDVLERRCEEVLDIVVDLTDEEYWWLKAVDRLEIWLWAKEQVDLMGNMEALTIISDVEKIISGMPPECRDFVKQYEADKEKVRDDYIP